jgi:type III restriction enzyme
MARAVITYDKDLPEIPDRDSSLPPTAYLRKKAGVSDEYEIVDERRPSKMLLVNSLRTAVGKWRSDGYPGASVVTRRLFQFWFDEDHIVNGEAFRYFFGQREAMETLVYLIEIEKNRDARPLIESFGEIFQKDLLDKSIEFQTTMDGGRQIRRYFPELDSDGLQYLPAENLRRFAFKMATGSGKTYVMAMAIVWSYFHKKMVKGSELSTNFLIIAPNVIVYQRLEKDFASNQIFYDLPLVPPEWQWNMKVILRGDSAEPDPGGNLFLTNIQQIYESRDKEWTPANAVDAILGRKPVMDLSSHQRSMLDRLKSLKDLVVLNDEAHHIHDEELVWHKTLMALHGALPAGLALWLDFSATPKDQNGTYFPWIICDYPLAQAVEDRIVKAPLIVHRVDHKDPENITGSNVTRKYGEWLVAALKRWKEHSDTYKDFGLKPVLFIMAEKNAFADKIGEWLTDKNNRTGLKKDDVLVIHTDSEGEITKGDLEVAREAARDIDKPGNKVKVIVSVMMLREGWDVRGVSVVLGLRPFTSKARILPEQAVGRGLRLMQGISYDRTQTLEVMGTEAFEDFVRQLELEGVGIKTTTKPPEPPIIIAPLKDKVKYDIAIPLTRPVFSHVYKKLSTIDPLKLDPIYRRDELEEEYRLKLEMEFATTKTKVHDEEIEPPAFSSQEVLSQITQKAVGEAKLTNVFSELYPLVRTYILKKCFGVPIDLEAENVRRHLSALLVQEGIARYLAREISNLIAEKREIEFEDKHFKLSDTQKFTWRRKHLRCDHTIFNFVASYNDFESDFARFLDKSRDISRFASLAEHFTRFRVDYLSQSGAIRFYYPDFVAVQKAAGGKEVNWIIETKGRIFENLEYKEASIKEWCKKVSNQFGEDWRYIRVDQVVFKPEQYKTFADLLRAIEARAREDSTTLLK